jgi:hypothetical protein
MFQKKRTFLTVTLGLWVCALIFFGCDANSNDADAVSRQGATTTSPASVPGTKSAEPIVPSGWKTVSDGQWSLSIPEDWVDDSGFYYPKEAANSMTGAPNIFCVIGTRTIPEGKTAEDELGAMLGSVPMNKTPKTVCDRDGYMVEAKNNLALVFELEASTSFGQRAAIEYINCGTPSSSKFNQYEPIFRCIVESTNCSPD